MLWSGEPTKVLTPQARQFSPKIKHIGFPTNLLRLEVNSSVLDYYTELDAVILRGVKERPMLALYKMPIIDISDLSDSEEELSDVGGPFRQGDGKHQRTGNGYFDKLPYEVITVLNNKSEGLRHPSLGWKFRYAQWNKTAFFILFFRCDLVCLVVQTGVFLISTSLINIRFNHFLSHSSYFDKHRDPTWLLSCRPHYFYNYCLKVAICKISFLKMFQ